MLIGVVGDFEQKKIQPKLLSLFSVFKKGNEIQFHFPLIMPPKKEKYIIDTKGANQAFVVMGHLGDYRLNPDFAPLQVMNMVLSGGFSGRLFENIRTKMGLAYSVFGHFGCERYYPGVFFVALKTKNQSVKQAILAVEDQLQKLKEEGCTEKEVEDAKEQFLNSLVFRYDSPKKVMERRLYYELRNMDADSFKKLIEDIKKVHAKDVNRVAKKYLKIDSLNVLVVGDKERLLPSLEELGRWNEWKLD
jgi:zinc protease